MPVRGGCCRWEKDYRPHRLAITPTIRHYVPASSPAGGRSLFGWLLSLGTGNQRLPCAKGAAPKGLRDCTWRGMLRTTLPSALRAATSPCTGEARDVGFYRRSTAKPMVTCCFLGCRRLPTRSLGCSEINFSTHQPARTATIESDVKSLCPFSGRHKGRTV